MTPPEIVQARLVNQQIAFSTLKNPDEVVARLGAMQAQDYAGALWAIGLRLPGSREKEIEQAVADRTIVRTWPMRGTLHFVAATDIHWMLKLLTPRILFGSVRRHQELELDAATFLRCEKVFLKALQGGRHLTREEMLQSLQKARLPIDGQRGYHILWRLAQEGLLCFGPRRGKQLTFALLHEYLPAPRTLEREEGLGELARRYFTGHGTATLQDFVWWSGLKVSDARAGIVQAESQLARQTLGDQIYWMSPTLPSARATSEAYLLPGFDEYMLGYRDRSAALDPRHAPKIIPGNNGIFMPTVVVKGRVVGTWKRTLKKTTVAVTASLFGRLNKTETRACLVAAERHGQYLGLAAEWQEAASA